MKGISARPNTTYGAIEAVSYKRGATVVSVKNGKPSPQDTLYSGSRSSMSLTDACGFMEVACPFPLNNVVPQPAPDYEPFGFLLAHTICLVNVPSVTAACTTNLLKDDAGTEALALEQTMGEWGIEPGNWWWRRRAAPTTGSVTIAVTTMTPQPRRLAMTVAMTTSTTMATMTTTTTTTTTTAMTTMTTMTTMARTDDHRP